MRRFHLILAPLLLALFACAGNQAITTAGGVSYQVYECKQLKVRLPLPVGWKAVWQKHPTSALVIHNPEQTAKMTIALDPLAVSREDVIEQAAEYVTRQKFEEQPQHFATRVSDHAANGFQVTEGERQLTVLAVDHDRGIYVITMSNRNAAGRDMLEFIFQRLSILED